MQFQIRNFHLSDLPCLYSICIKTANSGEDATKDFTDPELVGHYYAGPYAVIEPDLTFILTTDGVPCGYILGTQNSQVFQNRCEIEWFPVLRHRYPMPSDDDQSSDAGMIRAIHRGQKSNPDLDTNYPAHLHIDLLPIAQGQGWGRKLMETFLNRLRSLNVIGVHLGVGGLNQRAIAFYDHVGFHRVQSFDWGIIFGMKLQ